MDTKSDTQSQEAVQAATMHAEAVERARESQLKQAITDSEERMMKTFATALKGVFSETKKFDDIASGRNVNIDVVANDIANIKDDVKEMKTSVENINSKMERDFITRIEFNAKFDPIQRGFWWAACLIIAAFFASVASLVYKTHV